jgi:hypothetical protein
MDNHLIDIYTNWLSNHLLSLPFRFPTDACCMIAGAQNNIPVLWMTKQEFLQLHAKYFSTFYFLLFYTTGPKVGMTTKQQTHLILCFINLSTAGWTEIQKFSELGLKPEPTQAQIYHEDL